MNAGSTQATTGHWSKVSKLWNHVGPPLKPSPEDLSHYWQGVQSWKGEQPPRVLIMGVTTELYHLPWPKGSRVSALDNNPAMIDNVWPGSTELAHCGDWTEMPFEAGSFDIALCDGGLTMLTYPDGVSRVARELARVLDRGGVSLFRLYTPPDRPESPNAVFEDLKQGRIPDLSHFKLRIANAMQNNPHEGVLLADIWQALNSVAPDLDALADQIGWPAEHLRAIDTYREAPSIYRFMTLAETRSEFEASGGLALKQAWDSSHLSPSTNPVVLFAAGPA